MIETLTDIEIDKIITSNMFGNLGCCKNGKPHIFPMAYLYHNNVMYCQTTEGQKVEILRKHPSVCMQVSTVTGFGWQSVECWGMFEEIGILAIKEVDEYQEIKKLAAEIAKHQVPFGVVIPFAENDQMMDADLYPVLFKITLNEKTGCAWTRSTKL